MVCRSFHFLEQRIVSTLSSLLTLSGRQPSNDHFVFKQDLGTHRPRAWERAPRSSHLARHKGRKVWKRPDDTSKTTGEKMSESLVGDGRNPLGNVSSNTPKAVKRLRLKDEEAAYGENNPSSASAKYFITLRDSELETPRRESETLGF